ncbi:unnamed protein product [Kluyveromyces dobzhanskii CBS 2104]|uniref:WGS project CCBQ000000000 data, contig 00015 n=1 Tax=Kluyveromyces dobzhanskii CBS 2104 TaxID=1427455 RepID=A0A0A8LBJ6_9SACH|nr:unnamed protein product [Kluyveromyces dobzhanskii CBS 2104]
MLKVLRKISGHSSDAGNGKAASARRKNGNKDVNKDLRKPYNPETSQYPRQVSGNGPIGRGKSQANGRSSPESVFMGLPPISYGKQRPDRSVPGESYESNLSSQGSTSYSGQDTHESLIKQNRVNRKKSEQYYIYDFHKYRGPTDESVPADPNYNIFEMKDGINASSARYVIHSLTKAFKEQLLTRFSHENNNLETDVLKASMEIFKPNLSHFSSSEINHCKKIIKLFFPWEGCSLNGTALETVIAEHYGDISNPKHWTRLILSLRIVWSMLSHGIVPWKCYEEFRKQEARNNHPVMSFYNLLPQCLPNHDYTCSTFEFLEVLVAIISKIDLVVDKNAQMDLIFTAGQVCFVEDQNLKKHMEDNSNDYPDLISLGRLYSTRGTALLHLFVAYLRSLVEEGKVKDFYLIDNFHIDTYPPHPYKPITQTALTLTVPSFSENSNDFNTLLKHAAKAQSRIYSSNHSFSKQENAFLDIFEEDPYKIFDTIFSKSSKRYLYKFDKNFDPKSLRRSTESGFQQGLSTIGENDQYAAATWIEHCKGQDFSEFLNVLDDSGLGEGTLAFDNSNFNFSMKKQPSTENLSPVRVSKMPLSEWFISSWKYETFLHKVQNTLLIKLTKRVGDCDWLVLSTDERVGKSSYLTPPTSSGSAKTLENVKAPGTDSDNASIKSRPPPPNLLGDKSSSPLLESPSSSLYSSVLKKPAKDFPSADQNGHSNLTHKSKMSLMTAAHPSPLTRAEIMTPVENQTSGTFSHDYAETHPLPPVTAKVNNPSLVDLDPNAKLSTPYRFERLAPIQTPENQTNKDSFESMISGRQQFAKPLDFGTKLKSAVLEVDESQANSTGDEDLVIDERGSVVTTNTIQKLKAQLSEISMEEDVQGTNEDEEGSTEILDSLEVREASDVNPDISGADLQNANSNPDLANEFHSLPDEDTSATEILSVTSATAALPKNILNDPISPLNSKEDELGKDVSTSELQDGDEKLTNSSDRDVEKRFSSDTVSFFEDASSQLIRDDDSSSSEINTINQQEVINQSSAATTAESADIEKANLNTEIPNDKLSTETIETDKNDDLTNKSISLTPNKRLLRASALIDTQSSPNDILNDLIDNYEVESLVTVNSEGATLFEIIKSQMERVSNGKDLPPIPISKPVLSKLKLDLVREEDDHDSDNNADSSESLPLVTPTKGTSTIMSGFSYNATPPMKQNEFKYNGMLNMPQDSAATFYSSLDKEAEYSQDSNDQEANSSDIESVIIKDTVTTKEAGEENKSFRTVMLKTKKSFKSLKNKSNRT